METHHLYAVLWRFEFRFSGNESGLEPNILYSILLSESISDTLVVKSGFHLKAEGPDDKNIVISLPPHVRSFHRQDD